MAPIGPKLADSNRREWDENELRRNRNIINTVQYGYTGGANQVFSEYGLYIYIYIIIIIIIYIFFKKIKLIDLG